VSSLDYRALSNINAESALTFQPLLFSKYWNTLSDSEPVRILDLAAMQPSSIDFYSNSDVPCYLTIADSIGSLTSLEINEESSVDDVSEKLNHLIPSDNVAPYDIILFWECLNNIDADVMPLFQEKIKKVSHENTLLYGFLYTSNNSSGFPFNFKIQSELSFTCEEGAKLADNHKLINSYHLKKYFYDFDMSRSVLIRNGLQEFLMKRRA